MMDLNALREKPARFIIGLMSGSSADGIDAALVRVKGTGHGLALKLLRHKTYPYTPQMRTRLLAETHNAQELCRLNFELGELMAEVCVDTIEKARGKSIDVDFIATSGHTAAHLPPPKYDKIGTLAIGEPAIIAERTGLPVVSDFRQRDMAVGGQGAPLVPYADWILFKKLDKTVGCLNIGGIANYTVVTPKFDDILAFDTGPGNVTIDGAVRFLTRGDKEYDKDGRMAGAGMVIDEFLDYLLSHRYFDKVPPKSTGREEFGLEVYLRDALAARKEHAVEDLIATVTEAVARSIADGYTRFIRPEFEIDHLIIGGGGAKNKTLMKRITRLLNPIRVFTSDQYGIPYDAREAIAFAVLGNETICGTPANVPSATGAKRSALLGRITPA